MHALRHYGRLGMAEQGGRYRGRGRVAGDTVETVHRTCAHLMPGADYRGRAAMDEFFERAGDEGSAPDVPSLVATAVLAFAHQR
jgi:hypothetical protein